MTLLFFWSGLARPKKENHHYLDKKRSATPYAAWATYTVLL
jgi:hypothetical protein